MLPFYKLDKYQRQVVLLSSLGGMLEFYDFTVYGLFAAYFSDQFFPSSNEMISLVAGYSIFVMGYVVRPVGGIIFSYIGDAIGRKIVLVLTMILMGIASFGLGLLPTYAQIGVMAPILMLLFRLLQGLAIGGELPSMIVYVSESMSNKRGYGLGGVFSGTFAGLLPGMIINLLILKYLTHEQVYQFGWRIPFIIGGLLCIVAYFVRKKLHESEAFKQQRKHVSNPVIEVLTKFKKNLLLGVIVVAIIAAPTTLAIIFMPAYLTKIAKIDESITGYAVLFATIVSVLSMYIFGIVVQKIKLISVLRLFLALFIVTGTFAYFAISQQNSFLINVTLCSFAFTQGALVVIGAVLLSYLFPIEVRLSGIALSYNISFILFGGLLPVYMTSLIMYTKFIYVVPIVLIVAISLLVFTSIGGIKKYIPLSGKVE